MKPHFAIISGGFDPIHSGHIELIKHCWMNYTGAIIGVHGDEWLVQKKGYYVLPLRERLNIMNSMHGVEQAVYCANDMEAFFDTIHAAYHSVAYLTFVNGGDRDKNSVPEKEVQVCNKLGIGLDFHGGAKVESSSNLIQEFLTRIGVQL
jgi:D-beta-D-heptose 7-phosphate kinase/D-beta-D-heptose 1-phosphate adenosyltransferase